MVPKDTKNRFCFMGVWHDCDLWYLKVRNSTLLYWYSGTWLLMLTVKFGLRLTDMQHDCFMRVVNRDYWRWACQIRIKAMTKCAVESKDAKIWFCFWVFGITMVPKGAINRSLNMIFMRMRKFDGTYKGAKNPVCLVVGVVGNDFWSWVWLWYPGFQTSKQRRIWEYSWGLKSQVA